MRAGPDKLNTVAADNEIQVPGAAEIAERLNQLGRVRILDLRQAAIIRGIHNEWIHDGTYYLLPPVGITAAELAKVLDEFKARDLLHLEYNPQSILDTPHKPILPLDEFANKYFGSPPEGVVKVTAISRKKVAELQAIIEGLKRPFRPEDCPEMADARTAKYRPAKDGLQASLSLGVPGGGWKDLTRLEEALKLMLAEANLSREIIVGRHSVRGFAPEVMLSTAEGASEKALVFLDEMAKYLEQFGPMPHPEEGDFAPAGSVVLGGSSEDREPLPWERRPQPPPVKKIEPTEIPTRVARELADVLAGRSEFSGQTPTLSGKMILISFPKKGLLGTGGHLNPDQEAAINIACHSIRSTPTLATGWSARYQYDRDSRILKLVVGQEGEHTPPGWIGLT